MTELIERFRWPLKNYCGKMYFGELITHVVYVNANIPV